MERKVVGQVLPEERDEIKRLFERRNGLEELTKIVTADNAELYEKVIMDLGKTKVDFQSWWNRMSTKYHWERVEGANWEIDFDTCEITLTH